MFHSRNSKKEKEQKLTTNNYNDWEKDFGFLQLILSRKKGITKEFLIGVYSKQKDKDYLTDEEIEKPIQNIVSEVITQIGDNYKNFLIEKYFGTLENLIKYISEDVYVDITTDAIKRNMTKISEQMTKKFIGNISTLNNKK